MKVWILTSEYNDYDQHGEYFIEVFKNKPTQAQLEALGMDAAEAAHVLSGAGRRGSEHQWYQLREETAK